MDPNATWYRTLAWKFFLRQAATILVIIVALSWVAYRQAGHAARAAAGASLAAGSQVLARALEQQARHLDAGVDVFTQYSANLALIERALEDGAGHSLKDTLQENLPRLGADLALVARRDGTLLAATAPGAPNEFPDAGALQLALDPEAAAATGQPGPTYRGFWRVDWGTAPGIYHVVARTLRAPGGERLGAILAGIRIDGRTAAYLRRQAIPPPLRGAPAPQLALLSRFQTVGATFTGTEPLDRLLARDPAFLAERARVLDGLASSILPLTLDGEPYLGMISALRGVNALDQEMAQVLMMPVGPLLAPFRTLQRAILAAGFAGLVIALALGLHSARKVTAPLQALVSATEALAQGQAPATLSAVSGRDEVGRLTRAFRSMQTELGAKDKLVTLLEDSRLAGMGLPEPPPARPERASGPAGGAPELPESLRPGAVFASRYRVESVLGRGGMGVVLKVRDLHLEDEVALKVIRADWALTPAYLDQLKQEIRLARRISHRFVLRIHDFGEADGIPFVTMEYLKGTTLRSLLDGRGSLPLALVLRIARQVAEGLEAAHAVKVVHRDIKPMNVLFDLRGDVKIMDFGLAVPVSHAGQSEDEAISGTPRYMAPEQVRGEPVDGRTDLYALGVMIFELCAGTPPFTSTSLAGLLDLHLHAPPQPLGDLVLGLPEELVHLVSRLMAKDPDDRPQSAAEVVEILKSLAAV